MIRALSLVPLPFYPYSTNFLNFYVEETGLPCRTHFRVSSSLTSRLTLLQKISKFHHKVRSFLLDLVPLIPSLFPLVPLLARTSEVP